MTTFHMTTFHTVCVSQTTCKVMAMMVPIRWGALQCMKRFLEGKSGQELLHGHCDAVELPNIKTKQKTMQLNQQPG
jgi:hypothetical protein